MSPVPAPARGHRFTAEAQDLALTLVESGRTRVQVAREIGCTLETLRTWIKAARSNGQLPPRKARKRERFRIAAGVAGDEPVVIELVVEGKEAELRVLGRRIRLGRVA